MAGGAGPVAPASGRAQLRAYRRAWLRPDVVAGLTVTAYLVPQCLAYAELAGVAPIAGLWVAVAAMVAYALLGTSRLLSVGPESATAVMVVAAVGPLAAGDPARYAALAAGLALLVGLVCLAAWALRLGFLADLLSRPILVGYMAGVAAIMVASQLPVLTGISATASGTLPRVAEVAGRLDEARAAPLLLAGAVTAVLLLLGRLAPRAPAALVAVGGAALAAALLDPAGGTIARVGAVPASLPGIALPALAPADVLAMLGSAVAIAFVAYTDVALTGRAFAARGGHEVDPRREFLALGAANAAAGLSGGFPLSASASRTAILEASGARTQAAGLAAAAAVALVVLAAPGLVGLVPRAALGGVVVYAALRLVDLDGLRRLARFRPTELGLALAALGGVLVFDVLAGMLVAMALSVADLFVRVARPPASVLGRVPGLAGLHNVEDYPGAETLPGLVVFRYDGPLCFANANDFRQRAIRAATGGRVPTAWFLLNAEAIVELDVTAADALAALVDDLEARGITFAMARVKQDLRAQLERGGLLARIGGERLFPTLPVALEAFEARADAAARPAPGA